MKKLFNWLLAGFMFAAPAFAQTESKQIRPYSQQSTATTSDLETIKSARPVEQILIETARSDTLRTDGTRVLGLTVSSKTDYTDIENTQVDLVVPQGFQKKDVKVWASRRVINPNTPSMYRTANDSKRIPLEKDFGFMRHIAIQLIQSEQRRFGNPGESLQGKRGDLKILEDALAANGEIIIPLDYEPRECVEVGYRIEYALPQGIQPRISAIISSRSSRDKEHVFKIVAPLFTDQEAKSWLEVKQEGELEDYLIRDDEVITKNKKVFKREILSKKEVNPYYPEDAKTKDAFGCIPLRYSIAINPSSTKNDSGTLSYANYKGVLCQVIFERTPESDSKTIERIKVFKDFAIPNQYFLRNDKVWVQLEIVRCFFDNNVFDTPEEVERFEEGIDKYAKRLGLTQYFP